MLSGQLLASLTSAAASVTKITSRHSCHTEVLGTVQLWKSVVQVVKVNVV